MYNCTVEFDSSNVDPAKVREAMEQDIRLERPEGTFRRFADLAIDSSVVSRKDNGRVSAHMRLLPPGSINGAAVRALTIASDAMHSALLGQPFPEVTRLEVKRCDD